MHEQCTANMHKCQCMKFSCIISGCPAGARKWHISCFAMLLHSKNPSVAAYFFRTKRMPRVPGPQWQETVQPARVS